MKKIAAAVLTLIMLVSMLCIPTGADESNLETEITGVRNEKQAKFAISALNTGNKDEKLNVYVAQYDKNNAVKSVKKYTEVVKKGARTAFLYKADITDGDVKIFAWEDGMKPAGKKFSIDNCAIADKIKGDKIQIDANDVFASKISEKTNPPENAFDADIDTKWTVSGADEEEPESITAYLGSDYVITELGVAFGLGNEREYVFSMSVSEDGENFTELVTKRNNEKTNAVTYYETAPIRARYVRLTAFGRSDSVSGTVWTQVTEIEVYGLKDVYETPTEQNDMQIDLWNVSAMNEATYTNYTPLLGEYLYAENNEDGIVLYDNVSRDGKTFADKAETVGIEASQIPETENAPENLTDGDGNSVWTAKNVTDETPAYVIADMGEEKYVSSVGICFGKGSERQYTFDAEVSADGVNYVKVKGKTTAEKTDDMQYFAVEETKGRYVKINFYKRKDSGDNGWIKICDIEVRGGAEPFVREGAGGILVQKKIERPQNRGDYTISFEIEIPKKMAKNTDTNPYFSGITLADGIVSGGADLSRYAAIQLRFENDAGKFKIGRLTSNYMNEGGISKLFEKSFNKGEKVSFRLDVMPKNRMCYVTVSDSDGEETQLVYFNYTDEELVRNSAWTSLEANTLVFNTGAGAKCEMTVSDVCVNDKGRKYAQRTGAEPVNGIVRLEAIRLKSYSTSSSEYYGRYVYHNGGDKILSVAADKNPKMTRFAERRGLIGTGVSLEAVTKPGYFVCAEDDGIYLRKMENNGSFYAKATFYKHEAENVGYYTGKTYSYESYLKKGKYIYDTTGDNKTGSVKAWNMWENEHGTFYLRSEASAHISDGFKGTKLGSQWHNSVPWGKKNQTNGSSASAIRDYRNIIVKDDMLLLNTTKIDENDWVKDASGNTGTDYNGSYGKHWVKFKGRSATVSVNSKVFNRQCFVEGSFKQPESPVGFWNSFWLNGRDSWPPEIDIFEFLSSTYGHKSWHTAIHGKDNKNNLLGRQNSNTNLTDGFHTFSVDWGYDYIKFYMDGWRYAEVHNNDTLQFQKNMYLILSCGLGGWEAEPDDRMIWNDGMRVDWIRSFQY